MNDSNATILAFVLSLGLQFGYLVRLWWARQRAARHLPVPTPPPGTGPSESVTTEVKPRAKVRV